MRDGSRVMTMRGATLSRVIQTAADQGRSPATDRDLLRRFAEAGDQTAFEALVRRHTGLVLSVCRRALPNAQDAEDACQATFLVLARKAKAGRWQPSIANWLFATARKVARDLRRTADRRARREGRAAVPVAIEPVDQMTGRELLAAIDEELDRLPSRYREPLLLYYQEELAREEIAARLGVPAGTVKIRLERGRKKLGEALTKRGVLLSAGLLALMATSRAGASPPRVLDAVRAALAGHVPPTVAALAQGAAMNGVLKKVVLGLVALVAAAAVGLGLGEPRTTTAGPPPEKAMPAKAAAKADKDRPVEKAAEDKTRTIAGKVVDPDGKPVAGAEILYLPKEVGSPAVVGKTAGDGMFSVSVSLKDWSYLFPRAAGLAPGDFLTPSSDTPAQVTLKMVKDTPIRGRVLDTQGKPVAGAAVTVRSIEGFENDSLDEYLIRFQKRPADGNSPGPKWWASLGSGDRKLPTGGQVYAATADKDGRFAIEGVGSERIAHLQVAGPGIATAEIIILTRTGFDPGPYNRETLEKLKSPYARLGYHPMLHPPDAAIIAEAEKPIRGVVTDSATGKPRAEVTVTLREQGNHRMPELRATTDAAGRYEIHGAKKVNRYELSVKRDPKAGFIGRTVTVTDTPAYEPVTADIPTTKGIVLTGRLLDDQTGDPVQGFVCAGVLYDNEAAKVRPEFDSPDCYDFAPTGKDGVYRTIVPPGPVLLMAGINPTRKVPTESRYQQLKPDPDYPQYFEMRMSGFRSPGNSTTIMQGQWCKVFKLKPDETEVKFDVRFKRALEFKVQVRDADGEPVSKVIAAGNTSRDWAAPETYEADTCTVYDLEAGKPRLVVFLEPDRKLVGTLTLKGDEKEPAVATLGPPGRVKGKLVNSAGEPIANAVVLLGYEHRPAEEIDRRVNGDWRSSETKTETNAAGEFAIDFAVPGEGFVVYGRKKDRFLEPPNRKARVTVKPGEQKDVGTITMKEQ